MVACESPEAAGLNPVTPPLSAQNPSRYVSREEKLSTLQDCGTGFSRSSRALALLLLRLQVKRDLLLALFRFWPAAASAVKFAATTDVQRRELARRTCSCPSTARHAKALRWIP